jgi:DNA-binding PadR family transcriptional regulator
MTRTRRTKFALLGWLATCPSTGYDLKKAIERSTDFFWSESYGQIYPELEDMRERGLATVSVEPSRAGYERKVYSISNEGMAELKNWLNSPTDEDQLRSEFLLKLFFGAYGDMAAVRKMIEERVKAQEQAAGELNEITKSLETHHAGSPHLPYWLATARYGVVHAQASVQLLKDLLSEIDSGSFSGNADGPCCTPSNQ